MGGQLQKHGWMVAGLGLMLLAAACGDRERAVPVDGWLLVSPDAVDFARVPVHARRQQTVKLSNTGRSRLRIEKAWLEGPAEAMPYATLGEDLNGRYMASGEEFALPISYQPKAAGAFPAFLVIETDNRNIPVQRLPLNGLAVDARARVSPHELNFGKIEIQSSKKLKLRLENTGPLELPVKVTPVGADQDEFLGGDFALAAKERRDVTIAFNPMRTGVKQVALVISPCEGCADEIVDVRAEGLEQAVIAEPSMVDFGAVPVDAKQTRTVRIHNISTEPMVVQNGVLDSLDPSFASAPVEGFPLEPDASREFEIMFTPTHLGEARGAMRFTVRSLRHPTTDVPLRGHGGSAELCTSPPSQDFGIKPLGSKNVVLVHFRNCGNSPLDLTDAAFDASGANNDQFSLGPAALPRTLAAGEDFTLRAFYEPTRLGSASTTLRIRSTAYSAQEVWIPLSGSAQAYPPCRLSVTPSTVDFGNVAPGMLGVLGVRAQNTGSDLCAVKNIHLSQDAAGAFRLPGGDLDGFVLAPRDAFSFQVAFFAPLTGGEFQGLIQMDVADPAKPVYEIPLIANSQISCLMPTPPYLDFGAALPTCPPEPRTVMLTNHCPSTIPITALTIGAGTSPDEFYFDPPVTGLPVGVRYSEAFPIRVGYRAQVHGQNYAPLYVSVPVVRRPILVSLMGESASRSEKEDRFIQQDGSKVDVLFVIDNTASMVEEHPKLIAALPAFTDAALRRNVQLNVAVTTTGILPVSEECPGGALGGEAGRLFPVDGSRTRVLTNRTPNLADRLRANAEVGRCANIEQGLEVARRALTPPLSDSADDPRTPEANDGNLGFLRREAGLAIVVVTDEDDHSPETVDAYVKAFRDVKGTNQPGRVTLYAIAPTGAACATAGGAGDRYAQAALRTGGDVLSICAPDYAPLLESVASKAFAPQDRFPLSSNTQGAGMVVRVNGTVMTSGWRYDAPSNSVVFDPVPPAGAAISVSYQRSCRR